MTTEVRRYRMKDRASTYTGSPWLLLRSWWMLRDRRIQAAKGCLVRPGAEIRLTDNAVLELGERVLIDSYAFLQLTKPSPHLTIGNDVTIGRHNVIAVKGRTIIGPYTLLGPYCQINDQSHGFAADDLIMNQKAIIQPVTIGRDCWLGSGVRVLPGVTIGDGSVIGAGSVVTHDVPPMEVWAGVPARFIRKRT